MKINFKLLVVILAAITSISFWLVVRDSHSDTVALSLLTPFITACSSIGALFATRPFPWIGYSLCATTIVLTAFLFATKQRGGRYFIVSLALAALGQYLFVDRYFTSWIYGLLGLGTPTPSIIHRVDYSVGIPAGITAYILAVVSFIFGARSSSNSPKEAVSVAKQVQFTITDGVILGSIFVLALILRLYALNVVADSFEGELSPYSAGATSLTGMWHANRGTYGPWAPLGILYYIPIYLTTSIFAVDLVSLRLSSALVGLATLPLVFILAYRIAGRFAGHVATAFFAFNCLHIGWSRTDVHPHGVTTWPSLLLCWFLLKAYDTKKPIWAIGVAFTMGLTWHQYPSGQSAVILPIIALSLFFIFNRLKSPLSRKQLTWVLLGVGLWVLGLPLSYYVADGTFIFRNPFTLTGPRASWGDPNAPLSALESLFHVLSLGLSQTWDVIQGIFFKQPYFFHQEWVPYFDLIQARTVAWLEVPFLALGTLTLIRYAKRFESCILWAFVIAAILPGILSEHAYPKRLSTLYPALDIIAALGLAEIVKQMNIANRIVSRAIITTLACGFALYFCFLSNVWFSGRFWKMRQPAEIAISQEIARSITPGTIVLGNLTRGYDAGKYLYLLLDHLTLPDNRPNLWMPNSTNRVPFDIAHPLKATESFTRTWPYLWTKLDKQILETASNRDWQQILFIFQTNESFEPYQSALADAAKSRCNTPTISTIAPQSSAHNGLMLIRCAVSDLR